MLDQKNGVKMVAGLVFGDILKIFENNGGEGVLRNG